MVALEAITPAATVAPNQVLNRKAARQSAGLFRSRHHTVCLLEGGGEESAEAVNTNGEISSVPHQGADPLSTPTAIH